METEVKKKKVKKSLVQGPISAISIGESIGKHQSKTTIGAHDIFLGQVRRDEVDGKFVEAIEYTAYSELAEKEMNTIREAAFEKFELTCSHIYHSLGTVKAGEICLFVFVSSPHRKACFNAIEFMVNEIKTKVPIFGKEIFEDQSFQWKENN